MEDNMDYICEMENQTSSEPKPANEMEVSFDVIEIGKVIELDADVVVVDDDEDTPEDMTLPDATSHTTDGDMDAIVQHVRLNTDISKYKATVAMQRRRKPPTRGTALNRLTMHPQTEDFFDIQEFLEGNFEKSRKEIMLDGCKMREKKVDPQLEGVKRNSIVKRYSMPQIQSPKYGLTSNYLMQSRQRLNLEPGDAVKLRRNRLGRDESITKISENESTTNPEPRNAQISVESPSSESRNSAPEFMLQAQRMRKSWVEQNGLRIEKLLCESGTAFDQAKKRHSVAVSTLGQNIGTPKPKLLPKPRSPKKTESSLVHQSNGIKPIIPAVPKLKDISNDETSNKQIGNFSFKVECEMEKKGTYNDLSTNVIKEMKNVINMSQESIVDNNQIDTPTSPVKKAKPTTPTKPSFAFSKPKVLPSKQTSSPERKIMLTSKVVPLSTTEPTNEEKAVEGKKSAKDESHLNEEEVFPNETLKQTKPRPPIAQKPKSLQRVKSGTGASIVITRHKVDQNKSLEDKPKTPTDGNNADTTEDNETPVHTNFSKIVGNNNEKLGELDVANSVKKDKKSSNVEDSKCSRNNELEKNGSNDNDNSHVTLIKLPSNTDNNIAINNNTTPTAASSSIKEKPIFAFLKAKEANNQQSFHKGSDLNRSHVSSGLGSSPKTFINPNESRQDFQSSNPIIPQPKIITY